MKKTKTIQNILDRLNARHDSYDEKLKNYQLAGWSPMDTVERAMEYACLSARKNECMLAAMVIYETLEENKKRKKTK